MRKLTSPMLFLLGAAGGTVATQLARSRNLRTVRETFRRWGTGEGSLNELLAEDAVVEIPGIAPHCGTFSKGVFVRDVATPFMARFSKPPLPQARKFWSQDDDVVVLAEAQGIRRDGKAYANRYVFVLKLRQGRVVRATEFLDMAAFNEVWDQIEPVLTAGTVTGARP